MNREDAKKNILFVDDELNVMHGLKRMLRTQAAKWDMFFVNSGKEALAIVGEKKIDVIVSDMRMPDMDGAQLLNQVKEDSPDTLRIILSGYSSKDAIFRAIGPAHQYITKPCSSQELIAAIERSCYLHDMLAGTTIKNELSKITSLPSVPTLYQEIMIELDSPEASIKKIAEIISRDVSMTAKVMQLVNSVFFGLRRKINDIEEMVVYLGLETIKNLILVVNIFTKYKAEIDSFFSIDKLLNHSLKVGNLAKAIAATETKNKYIIYDSIMVGMFHDLGKLILADNFSFKYKKTTEWARKMHIPLFKAEKEVFGISHGEVCAYLLALWNFSDSLVEAVAFHHNPSQSNFKTFSPLTAGHAADVLINSDGKKPGDLLQNEFDMDYLKALDLDDHIQKWQVIYEETTTDSKITKKE